MSPEQLDRKAKAFKDLHTTIEINEGLIFGDMVDARTCRPREDAPHIDAELPTLHKACVIVDLFSDRFDASLVTERPRFDAPVHVCFAYKATR